MNKDRTYPEYFAGLLLGMYLGMQVFAGLLRWLLDRVHLAPLIYIKDLCLMGSIACMVLILYRQRETKYLLKLAAIIAVLLIWTGVGYLYTGRLAQAIFGLKVLIPLIAGLAMGPFFWKLATDNVRWIFIFWACLCSGVVLNSFVQMPWQGYDYTIGDYELSAQLTWNIEGIQRLAGFGRISFDAAAQAAATGLLLICLWPSLLLRLLTAGVTLVIIYLTTSRSMLLGFCFGLMAWFILSFKITRFFRWFVLPPVPLLVVAFLFFGLYGGRSTDLLTQFDVGGVGSTASIFARFESNWLDAVDLVDKEGSPWTGRGIGGVGAALAYFDPAFAASTGTSADNMALYLYATFGIFGAAATFLILELQWLRRLFKPLDPLNTAVLSCCSLVYGAGLTLNAIEGDVLSFLLGASILGLSRAGPVPDNIPSRPPESRAPIPVDAGIHAASPASAKEAPSAPSELLR